MDETSLEVFIQLFKLFLRCPFWLKSFLNVGNILTYNHLDENIGVNIREVKELSENCHSQSWKVKIDAVERKHVGNQCIVVILLVLEVFHVYNFIGELLEGITEKDNGNIV